MPSRRLPVGSLSGRGGRGPDILFICVVCGFGQVWHLGTALLSVMGCALACLSSEQAISYVACTRMHLQ